jgi:hypothetical protein
LRQLAQNVGPPVVPPGSYASAVAAVATVTVLKPKMFMKNVGSALETCTVISGFPDLEKSGVGTVMSDAVNACPPTLFCSAAAVAESVANVVTVP